jgi:hypothetical protein
VAGWAAPEPGLAGRASRSSSATASGDGHRRWRLCRIAAASSSCRITTAEALARRSIAAGRWRGGCCEAEKDVCCGGAVICSAKALGTG